MDGKSIWIVSVSYLKRVRPAISSRNDTHKRESSDKRRYSAQPDDTTKAKPLLVNIGEVNVTNMDEKTQRRWSEDQSALAAKTPCRLLISGINLVSG